jgi:hypothetical protein
MVLIYALMFFITLRAAEIPDTFLYVYVYIRCHSHIDYEYFNTHLFSYIYNNCYVYIATVQFCINSRQVAFNWVVKLVLFWSYSTWEIYGVFQYNFIVLNICAGKVINQILSPATQSFPHTHRTLFETISINLLNIFAWEYILN